ncbi:MAG: translocation/assembly module TamB domain-containing protein [Leptolyngbyaceae bacterium]|nr:translocation/assembly module TamB domain-containing protein [Leptolyngbyaceae bacterium]
MTPSPFPGSNPNAPSPAPPPGRFPRLGRWQWFYLLLGGAIAISSSVGYWRLRQYVYQELAPQLEQTLTQRINRPLELGAVEDFSPFHLRLGTSALPPTATDRDRATVESIAVYFNPLKLLLKRQLTPTITLINPDITIDQDRTGQWLHIQFTPAAPGPIQINLAQINLEGSTLVLKPFLSEAVHLRRGETVPASSVLLTDMSGQVRLRHNNRLIGLELEGQTLLGGSFQVDGRVNLDQYPLFQGRIETDRLPLAPFSPLGLAYLPPQLGHVTHGFLNTRVNVILADPKDQTRLEPALTLQGRAEIWEMAVKMPKLAQPLRMERANILFRDERINLRQVRLAYGKVRANANGQLHLQDGYDLTATVPMIAIKDILAATELELPFETRGNLSARLRVTGALVAPVLDATVTNKRPILIDQIRFDRVQSRLRLTSKVLEIGFFEALPQIGGSIQGGGRVSWGTQPLVDLALALRGIPGDDLLRQGLARWLAPPRSRRNLLANWVDPVTGQPLTLGTLTADLDITGPLKQLEAIAQFQAPQATFPIQGEAVWANQVLLVNGLAAQFPQGRVQLDGRVDFDQQRWQALAQVEQVPLNQLIGKLPLDQIPIVLAIPPMLGMARTTRVELGQTPSQPYGNQGQLDGRLSAAGTFASFRPEAITLNGELLLSNLPFSQQPLSMVFDWTGTQLRITDFSLSRFMAYGAIELRFTSAWQPIVGPFDLNLRISQLDLAAWELPLADRVELAGVTDFNGRIFGTLARPNVDARLQFQGLSLNQVRFESLAGPVRYRPDDGLLVDLRGDRDRIAATLDSTFRPVEFALNYGITPETITQVEGVVEPGSGGDRLRTKIREFPLSVLNLDPVPRLAVGTLGGTLNADAVVDLSEWDWRADNWLDRLAWTATVAIAQPNYGYLAATCLQGAMQVADGVADIRNGQLWLRPNSALPDSGPVPPTPDLCPTTLAADDSRYTFNGRLVASPTPAFSGEIAIEQGQIQDWLQTLQIYDIGDLAKGLRPAEFASPDAITLFPLPFADSGPVAPSNTSLLRQLQRYAEIIALREQQRLQQQNEFVLPQLQELAGTFSGEIDLTASLDTGLVATFNLGGTNWRWGDYDPPNQIIAQGEFSQGTITFLPLRFESGDSRLNFAGSVGWNEDATGQFQATNISMAGLRQFLKLPLNIDGNLDATAAITGNLQNPQARGNVTLRNASLNRTPIQTAEATFSYADARLGVIGRMQIRESPPPPDQTADATTEEPLANRNQGESPGATAAIADPIPDPPPRPLISLIGSLPYRLPFATVDPDQNNIDLKLAIQDDGIALLNLLNEHFFWESGQGTVTLDVGGTLDQTDEGLDFRPTIVGTAQVDAATFSARVLPAPLTQVTGNVQFDGDRITVNTIQGQFSDGNFSASGVIPLLEPFTAQELSQFPDSLPAPPTPVPPAAQRLLAIDLNSLLVNFKGLYNGGVNGRITIGGTALKPQLGGEIILAAGRVSLPDPTIVNQANLLAVPQSDFWSGLIASPELTNLKVTLGPQLLITRLPLLNFLATGELMVNGPLQRDLSSISPQGVITLHSGQVNVFATQFNLNRSHNNVAIFTSRTGSDPFLDVRLETSVLEETRRSPSDDSILSRPEIAARSANNLSQVQTVRIEAAVVGQASQLFNSIELSSSPSRSEAEIIALIGGGFVDTLGRSEGFVGIANLAGTALFTSLQTLVSNAVGFSDLRIFPTVISNADEDADDGRPATTLALAAELGFKFTRDLSVSVLQLLTANEPTQYNLRYQINEELLLRGSTNLSDENQIILEFETRF